MLYSTLWGLPGAERGLGTIQEAFGRLAANPSILADLREVADYPINLTRLHWESQSGTTQAGMARLDEPATALRGLKGLVVIDEIQRKPDLFPVIRVLADRTPLQAKFLVLGSASPALLRQSSESLAGRVETVAISGFSLAEAGLGLQARHWLRGGFPSSFLARTEADSLAWRKNFIQAAVPALQLKYAYGRQRVVGFRPAGNLP